jgi:RNA recognition motif-containing protein
MTRIFVGNLDFNTTNAELSAAFAEYGSVENVSVITDRLTGRSRGFAFVEMSDRNQAETAISVLNGSDLQGRTLKVSQALPKSETGRFNADGNYGDRDRNDRPRNRW